MGISVVGRAAMSLVPTRGDFSSESKRECEARSKADYVFGVERAEQRTPVHFRRGRIIKKGACGARVDELRQTWERGLAVLAERNCFIRLKLLEPRAETQ